MFGRKKDDSSGQSRQARSATRLERERIFVYHSSRSLRADDAVNTSHALQPEVSLEQRARAVSGRPRRLMTSLLTSLMLITLVWGFYLDGRAAVVVLGDKTAGRIFLRDRQSYETAAAEILSKLRYRNKITIDTDQAARELEQRFPELQAVSISLPVAGITPTVYVYPSQPKLIFVSNGEVYLLDRTGRALITGNQVPSLDDLHIPVVNDQSGLPVELGKIVLPETTVAFITEVVEQLNAKGITTESLILPPSSTEVHVRMVGTGYYVKYNLHGDAREEVGSYLAVRRYLESHSLTPAEYVDVRVSNKAYYR